jgi:transposase-like protein
LPWLSLPGGSTGDFSEAFQALLGPDAPGVSPAPLRRREPGWQEAVRQWQRRELAGKRSVYFWVDGVYCAPRLEEARHCILVIIGADARGCQACVGLWEGWRESAQSWQALRRDLKSRGLVPGPAGAIGDGALGFWKALRQVYGQPRWQRGWVHKTANVVDKLPKAWPSPAKQRRQARWRAPDRQQAARAVDLGRAP